MPVIPPSSGGGAGVTDHGALTGLTDDDHTIYVEKTDAATIQFVIDGGSTAIGTGVAGYVQVPFAATITAARAFADASGSAVVDIWKDSYANYPPTDADTITASAPVTLAGAAKSEDTTLTGWTTSITAGDILGYNVDSNNTIERLTVALTVTRT